MAYSITGKVVDPKGTPVPMASVGFVEAPVAIPDIAALSGVDGSFELSAPVAGEYKIAVTAEAFAPLLVSVVCEGQSTIGLKLQLRPEQG